MEPINDQLRNMKDDAFEARLQKIQQDVLQDPMIQTFIREQSNVFRPTVDGLPTVCIELPFVRE